MTKQYDHLYSEPLSEIADFRFDEQVAGIFADMIQRSVPGYATVISNIGILTGHYAQANSCCYDLGCSLGAATLAMRKHIRRSDCRIIAVDNSEAMLNRCRAYFAADASTVPVDIICADITAIDVNAASVIVLNYTLQFLPPEKRGVFLRSLYEGMLPGGILILSEKIRFQDQSDDVLYVDWHYTYKKANGYSELEISQKRAALERVLIPDTESGHLHHLQQAGFKTIKRWFQCFNFISLLAIK